MEHICIDLSDEIKTQLKRIMEALFEAFKEIRESIKRFVNSFSKVLNPLKQINEKKHKTPVGYYRIPKNQYLKIKTPFLYRFEQKVQKHLPYHRRAY